MTAVIALGLVNLGQGLYLPAKAALAQHLVQRAWQRGETIAEPLASQLRPWPWADTHPVARLTSDASDDELFVLSGASGRTLAFGPGHLEASVLPGDRGNSIIIGHRDTHFRFLEDLQAGDHLVIDRRDGRRVLFVVTSLDVVDASRATLRLDTGQTQLTLVTCYPFDAVRPGGSLRYVVSAASLAEPVDSPQATQRKLAF